MAETDAVIAGGGQPADDRAEEDAGPAPADVLPDDDEQEAHPETEPEAGPEDEPDEGADEANVSADLPTDAQPPDAGGEAPRSDGADGAGADAPLVDGELADGDEDDLANEPADEGRSAAADEDDGAEAGEAEANEAAGGGEGGADGDGVEPGALGEGEEGEGGDDGAEPGDDDEGQYAAGDAEGGEEGADEGEEGAAAHASGGARVYDDDDVEPRDDTAEAEADEAEEEDGEEEDEEEEAGGMYGDDDDDAYNDFDMGLDGGDPLGEEAALSEAELAAQIAERFDAARDEHDARLEANQVLQRKLVEHLRTAKSAEEKVAEEGERASAHEQEGRYVKALAQLQTLKAALAQVQERFDAHAAEMNKKLTQKEEKAREIADAFADFKREIMAAAENSRTSRPIAPKLIRHFDDAERKRDDELAQMRLTHISRRNQKDKLEYTLRQKEKLADGLHLIDFEQLKIENQTLNEKIEERNEELLKLRKKMSTSAHVLTHFKEKLQFVAADNTTLKAALAEREVQLVGRRDQLTSIKQARDSLRVDNAGMKSTRPLVNSEELLLDFERRKHKLQERKAALDALQARHSELAARARPQRGMAAIR
ncbi:hypothetical protein KFE25_004071 [Diacronema lutheri]|uniref:CCDC113/CCDC96 coiled-coil domain-containing protein n=1 Tax=Diacronema lutheri TaxID=2081491 RepID=A0A8J5XGQ5_DIALT|nr:hypothetical protein KFE25_004071 [Diacronema lutheri]